jgi:hypothetical protein
MGLIHHLVEQALEAFGFKSLAEAAMNGMIGWQLLGPQTKERLEEHIPRCTTPKCSGPRGHRGTARTLS